MILGAITWDQHIQDKLNKIGLSIGDLFFMSLENY